MSIPRHRLTRTVASALAVTALAAPAAEARYDDDMHAGRTVHPGPTVSRTIDDGFDMGSAALGAGGAAAVLLLTAAGASTVSHRHQRVGVAG